MNKRRVVITGIGIHSPAGLGLDANWQNIIAGNSGISSIESIDTTGMPASIAGQILDFDPENWIDKKSCRKMDRFIQLGMAAGLDAMADSGLEITEEIAPRVGVHIGAGIGGLTTIEKQTQDMIERGPRRISPFYIPSSIINMISGNLSISLGAKGPNLAVVTACATGTHSIGDAARLIEYGDADVMFAGGAESSITPTAMAGFGNARTLSTRNDDPQAASRPWDKDRDGFVMGEGAAVMVLEELEHARQRGAQIYAELAGFGLSGDAYHMTSPIPDGEGAARCMENAMRNAAVNPQEVDYINAHGTSTPLGDVAETVAVKRALGDHAKDVAISSTKSMTGHLLGAAGAIEAVYTTLALKHQIAPPTINLDDPDPECDLDYVPATAREMKIDVAMTNSFGFGGTNGTLIMKRMS
ncbi:MAG: beta-ketoacyl-ACP synthase II [Arenicellales bacterium]